MGSGDVYKRQPIIFSNSDYKVQPMNGLLVMFPGWVKHEVPPQETDHERVMVAGNLNCRSGMF